MNAENSVEFRENMSRDLAVRGSLNMKRDRKPASVEVMASLDDPLEFGSESRFAFLGSNLRNCLTYAIAPNRNF